MIKSCYIHIPFCKKICSYCDFCKLYYNKVFVNKYLDSLENEIKALKADMNTLAKTLDIIKLYNLIPENEQEKQALFWIKNFDRITIIIFFIFIFWKS